MLLRFEDATQRYCRPVLTNPAALIQSPNLIFTGSSALIIERGRATFTLFLGDIRIAFGAERDLRASAMLFTVALIRSRLSRSAHRT